MADLHVTTNAGDQAVLAEAKVEEFRLALRGELLRAGDEGYDAARTVFNTMIDRHPSLMVRCAGTADIMRAVNFARDNELLTAVRGAGHNVTGSAVCDGGIVIDLRSGPWTSPTSRWRRASSTWRP